VQPARVARHELREGLAPAARRLQGQRLVAGLGILVDHGNLGSPSGPPILPETRAVAPGFPGSDARETDPSECRYGVQLARDGKRLAPAPPDRPLPAAGSLSWPPMRSAIATRQEAEREHDVLPPLLSLRAAVLPEVR